MVLEETLKLLLTPIFSRKILSAAVAESYEITSGEAFVIKLSSPLDEPLLFVPKDGNFHNLIKEDIINLLISSFINVEIYRKKLSSVRLKPSEFLAVLSFDEGTVIVNSTLIEKILNAVIREPGERVKISARSLDYLQAELDRLVEKTFYRLSGIPWDLDDFFQTIDKVSLQFILSKLLSSSSEDEMATLVLTLKKSGDRIVDNISERAWENIKSMSMDKRDSLLDSDWVEATRFFFSIRINRILREEEKNIPLSRKLSEVREIISRSFYMPRASRKAISNILITLDSMGKIDEILNYVNRTTLVKALVGLEDSSITNLLSRRISQKGHKLLMEDIRSFSEMNRDFIKERAEFLNGTMKLLLKCEEEKEGYRKMIENLIPKLDFSRVFYATSLTGSASYLMFVESIGKNMRSILNDFLSKTLGPMRTAAELFLRGRIKFTFLYGDTTLKEKFKEFLEHLYFTVKIDEFWK